MAGVLARANSSLARLVGDSGGVGRPSLSPTTNPDTEQIQAQRLQSFGSHSFSSAVDCSSGPFGRGAARRDFTTAQHCLSVWQLEGGGNPEAAEPHGPSLRAKPQGPCSQTLQVCI